MNSFDIAALILTASSAARGYRTGLASEFYRLFRLVVALVTGSSLYRILADSVGNLAGQSETWMSPVLFVGLTVVVWKFLKRLRRWMEAMITARVPARHQAIGGAVAAGAKTMVFIAGVIGAFSLASWLPGHDLVVNESTFAHWLRPLLSR